MAIDRIRGNLSTQARLSGNLYRSGGGGSTVTIEPVYNSGIKIVDYSIDEDPGEIFIPNYPEIDNLYDMTWTKIIDIMGGAFSSYTDVSSYKYFVVVYSYNGVSHEPYIYKISDLDKLLSITGDTSVGIGYQWRLGADSDFFGIYYRNDKTLSIAATYSGIRALAYGVS